MQACGCKVNSFEGNVVTNSPVRRLLMYLRLQRTDAPPNWALNLTALRWPDSRNVGGEGFSRMSFDVPLRFETEQMLWTVDQIYTPSECADLVTLIEQSSPTLATNNPLYRDQDRVIRDDPELANDLFRRLRPHLPEQMGPLRLAALNDRLRFYRYRPGQRFEPHMDHWYRPTERQVTLHTVLAYFNDDFEGGETVFQEQFDRTVVPKAGMIAIFQHKLRHEGRPVLRGTKYAMRSDVIYEADEPIGRAG